MPLRQHDQFLDQFLILAAKVQFIEDFTHAAQGPKLLDEGLGLVGALFGQRGGEVELLGLAADHALHDDLGRAALLVASDHHQLLAGKQIERVLRIDPIDR